MADSTPSQRSRRSRSPRPALWVDGVYIGAPPMPAGREVMPLTDFPLAERLAIGDAVLADKKPEQWLDLRLAMIPSRAWFEWHWARGIGVGCESRRPPVPTHLRLRVYGRDGFACVTCGSIEDLTLDHTLPYSLGGRETYENLQTMCRPCNSRKGARI